MHTFSAEVVQGNALLYFDSYSVKKYPFQDLCSASFSHFCAFLLVIFLHQTVPKHISKVLASVSMPKKGSICLSEKMCISDKLDSGMSYSAIDYGFTGNESTIYTK